MSVILGFSETAGKSCRNLTMHARFSSYDGLIRLLMALSKGAQIIHVTFRLHILLIVSMVASTVAPSNDWDIQSYHKVV